MPRTWALVWLAGAHRAVAPGTAAPEAWRARWAADAERFGTPELPATLEDDPTVGASTDRAGTQADDASRRVIDQVVARLENA